MFAIWQIADLLAPAFPAAKAVRIVALIAWLLWALMLVRSMRLERVIRRDPTLRRAFDDELARINRLRSFAVGYWTMLGATGIALVVSGFGVRISGEALLRLIVVAGVVAPIAMFALQERE